MDKNKLTLVVGASENPERYSNLAIRRLRTHGFPVLAYGLREGRVGDVDISKDWPSGSNIHTVTLYVGPKGQTEIMEDIMALKPNRVIFNPGTENPLFYEKLTKAGIVYTEACTLVLLSTGSY